MDCFFATDLVQQLALAGVGLLAIFVAHKRLRAAERARFQDQFLRGATLLDYKNSAYSGRVAGAEMLANLASTYPREYDKPVMRVFQSFLDFPPSYGENHRKEGQVDYGSFDTVAIVEAINKRKKKKGKNTRST